MSAIAGVYYPNGRPVERRDLEAMLDSMEHRGPDGAAVWVAGPVGLGHALMRVTGESLHERLPLVNSEAGLAITADARIDNRKDLLDALGPMPKPAAEVTDSELILASYEKWGEDCPDKLLGDFAFAIRDDRRGVLFCARDPMGVKPFYYHVSPGRLFVFATHVRAILRVAEVPRRINDLRIAECLVPTLTDPRNTIYEGVHRLEGGHSMVVRDGITLRNYWRLDTRRELRLRSDDEYAERFRNLFTEAVRSRMRAAFPVGATLSGGMDSSSTACVAQRLLPETGQPALPTFSATWPTLAEIDSESDEGSYIRAVLRTGKFDPHFVPVDTVSPLQHLMQFQRVQDEPTWAPNLYMYWPLFEQVRRTGTRVILTGNDGDATVNYGLGLLSELFRQGRWLRMKREAEAYCQRRGASVLTPRSVMWDHGIRPNIPPGVRHRLRKLRGYPDPVPSWVHCRAINPDFAARVGLKERMEAETSGGSSNFRVAHAASFRAALTQQTLELLNNAGSAFGIDVRHPFYDRRLLEFCLSMPHTQKLRDGWTRFVLRNAMDGILPQEVQWRVWKGRLGAHFKKALLERDRDMVEDFVLGDGGQLGEFADMPKLRRIYHRYAAAPLRQDEDAFTVFLAVTLAAWLREAERPAQAVRR